MEYNFGGRTIPYLPQGLDFRQGKPYAPDRPGLGVEVHWSKLKMIAEYTEHVTASAQTYFPAGRVDYPLVSEFLPGDMLIRMMSRNSTAILVGLLLCSALTAQTIKTGPAVGEKVPSFSAPDQNGREQTLSSVAGPKGIMLVFFRSADW